MTINDILKYWTLCELSDFESFKMPNEKIESYLYIEKLDINTFNEQNSLVSKNTNCEYYRKDEFSNGKSINKYKKTNIYKLFLGLIKVEDFIKFLYEKAFPSLIKSYENELERINTEEYTYIGYIYLDYLGNIISIENKSIIINPIFYILKNISEQSKLNNFNYSSFIEKFNDEFSEEYKITRNCFNIIVPSFNYLMKTMKPTENCNPFKFLEHKNSKIIIYNKLYNNIKELAANKSSEYCTNASIYYNYLTKIKNKDISSDSILFVDSPIEFRNINMEQYSLDATINLSLSNSSNLIYYLTDKYNQLEDNIKIPINMYIYEFFKEENLFNLNLKAITIKDNIDFSIIQKKIIETFEIPKNLLYKDNFANTSIFIGLEHKDLSLNNFKNIIVNQMISFYIDALSEEPKKLTIDYIKGTTNRIDVNESISNRKRINDLKYFKSTQGKWPSKNPLYYAQQAAVNLFLSKYNEKGNIFSVNGPPGTGKTTLLKDVIANIIIKRVQYILDLDSKIFRNNELDESLVGKFEIIVTSNNNTAVENITVDLPKIDQFDFSYLECTKDVLLLSNFVQQFYGYESWNLFSLKLGKKANVEEFKSKFENIIEEIKQTDKLTNELFLNTRLDELKKQFYSISKYLEKDEDEFKSFDELPIVLKSINSLNEEIKILNENIDSIKKEIDKIDLEKKEKKEKSLTTKNKEELLVKKLELKKENLNSFGFFAKFIFKRKIFNDLKKEIYQINDDYAKILENKAFLEEEITKLKGLLNFKNKELEKVNQVYIQIDNKRTNQKTKYNKLLLIFENKKYHIPNDEYFNLTEKEIQRDEKLYCKDSYLKNKSLLFLISLQISEVVFLKNIDKFASSINNYLDLYSRDDLLIKDLEKLQKNFSSLFFIFPVVSTTLASSYTMLKNIRNYGTLICDESGQATPQSLVGVLNRANNALIVGDPLQVEPVFTVPEIVINMYNDAFNIPPLYSPTTSSAQQLADNANNFGSYYEVQNKKVWVGMPLVVHRRCLAPMFTISNKISYNEKMVSDTNYNDELINQLPDSCWIDVVSSEQDFNINSSIKEIKIMNEFIDKYKHLLNNNYYIISPFKSINSMFINNNDEKDTKKIHGTVHTFQGKEADVVFIILGGKKEGSKAWAAQKANILNVALTRAKKKVYIIGDYNKWKNLNYFNTATDILKRYKFN